MSRLDAIEQFCTNKGIPWSEDRTERMTRYLELLVHFNESMNLIGPMEPDEIVDELLLDSLVAAAARRPGGPILDVGSGAGLPGIPLKIAFPDCSLTLVEPRGRRSTFLKIAIHRLGLDDVRQVRGRIEEFDESGFDYVISKAFREPTKWLRTARPFAADDGAVVCMARQRDRSELVDAAGELGFSLVGEATREDGAEEMRRVCFVFARREL